MQQALHEKLTSTGDGVLRHARVYMKPLDIISGDFFNTYIKSGNIVMLSEGRSGTDNVLSLSEGVLRIKVDKPTYEKMGLEGKAVGGDGRKHVKARFGELILTLNTQLTNEHETLTSRNTVIEANLRLPSMLPGKKAFDRLKWAFKNVLDSSLAWLFYDLRSPIVLNGEVQGALADHGPTIKVLEPTPEPLQQALCPSLQLSKDADDEGGHEEAIELLEWLSLAMMGSPRVQKGDGVDPFLSRYRPAENSVAVDLVRYQWHGFAPAAFVLKVLLAALRASSSTSTTNEDGWFAISGDSFEGNSYTVLKHGSEVMTWNYAD